MRIGLIIYGSLDTVSGGYLYDRKLVLALECAGCTVDIISLPWRTYGRHITDNFKGSLFQRLKASNYDLLLQDELNHPSLFWLNRRLKPAVDYPIVSVVHHLRSDEAHSGPAMPLYRRVERAYLRSCDQFIFNSQTTKARVTQLLGRPLPPHHIALPAGDRFDGMNRQEIEQRVMHHRGDPLNILAVGNLAPRKGIHTLITAIGALPRDQFRVHLIGNQVVDPPYVRSLKRQVVSLGLEDQVTFVGALPDAELAQMYWAADLLVVPSQYEGFGIVYLEGMGFGLPAIGGAAGGATEIIREGENGYLLSFGDVAGLVQHLQRLDEDRDHLLKLSLAARGRFEAHPTWEESMAGAVSFLQDVQR